MPKVYTSGGAASYTSIFDLAPFPMWIFDLETLRFLAVNQEAIRHYGYSCEEFSQMTLRDIRPVEDIPQFEKAINEARYRTEPYKQSLFKHKKKDGSIMWVQLKANLIKYQGKKAEIVTAVDMTERYLQETYIADQKRFQATIAALNEILLKTSDWRKALKACFEIVGKFLTVSRIYFLPVQTNPLNSVAPITWIQDAEQNALIEFKNGEMASTLNYLSEVLKEVKHFQSKVSDLPPSLFKDTLIDQKVESILVLPVLLNNQIFGYVKLDDCIGRRHWQEQDIQLLYGLLSNLGPVIKAAQSQQELLKSEARFRSLVQNGTDLTAIINSKGELTYVSPAISNVMGISPETLLGPSAFELIHKDDVDHVKECLARVATQKRVSVPPYRFPDAQNNWRWLQTKLSDHLDDPAIEGVVANTWEVTAEMEKRKGEELLTAITKKICQPGSLVFCLGQGLAELIALTQINIAEVWLVSEDKSHLHLISKGCQDKELEGFYQDKTPVDVLQKGEGLPGKVWEKEKSCIWGELLSHKNLSRQLAVERTRLKTAIGTPIFYNENFLGCFICFSEEEKETLSGHKKLFTDLGTNIGPVVKQKIIEEEYRSFFNIAPDPQCIIGYDGHIKKFNTAFFRLLEYGEDELLTRLFADFLHPDDKAQYESRLQKSIAGAPTRVFEGRFLTKTGEVKWLVWSGTRIPEEKIIIAAAQEVTAQKKAEQELKTAYGRLQAAQKIAKLGYWVRDLDSDLSEWSDETYRIYGYTPENFVPTLHNITQTFHPEDRLLIKSDPNAQLVPGVVKTFDSRIITASKEVKWIRQEIRLLADEKNVPYRIEGTIKDITEKKVQELLLTRSNERFQLAMKASNEMIWELDCQHQRIIRGKGYEKSIPYESSEPFAQDNSWFKRIYPADVDAVWESLQAALSNKEETYWNMEYRMFKADGSLAYFMDRCFIVRDENGCSLQCVGSALDVTATMNQLEKIKVQSENLREIAWLQSHVIRAPLTRIMGLVYLAKEHQGGGKSLEELCEMVGAAAEELDRVIHAIILKTETIEDDETDFTD